MREIHDPEFVLRVQKALHSGNPDVVWVTLSERLLDRARAGSARGEGSGWSVLYADDHVEIEVDDDWLSLPLEPEVAARFRSRFRGTTLDAPSQPQYFPLIIPSPPSTLQRLLYLLAGPGLEEAAVGDLAEMYPRQVARLGSKRLADWWYGWQAVRSICWFISRSVVLRALNSLSRKLGG